MQLFALKYVKFIFYFSNKYIQKKMGWYNIKQKSFHKLE